MYLPIKARDGSFKVLKMNEDVLLLQTDGQGQICFYTYEEEYRAIQRVEEWAHLLRHMGFLRIDRGTIVNLHKVEQFDPILRVLILNISSGPLTIPVAEPVVNLLTQELQKYKFQ